MAFPMLPGPNPPALLLSFAALLAARRRPGLAGAMAGLACLFRFELGVAAIAGVLLTAPRGRRARALGTAAAVAVVSLGPFFVVAPHAMWHDTIGFYAIQGLQRLPFPLAFHGPWRPSKLIEFYIPLILVVGLALWCAQMAVGRQRRRVNARASMHGGIAAGPPAPGPDPEAWSLAPLALVGLGYLLGPHRRLPPRPAGRRAAGDAGVGGGGVARGVAAGGAARRGWRSSPSTAWSAAPGSSCTRRRAPRCPARPATACRPRPPTRGRCAALRARAGADHAAR